MNSSYRELQCASSYMFGRVMTSLRLKKVWLIISQSALYLTDYYSVEQNNDKLNDFLRRLKVDLGERGHDE